MKEIKNNKTEDIISELMNELEKREDFCCQTDRHGNQDACFIVLCTVNNDPSQPLPENFGTRLFRWLFGEDLFR